MKILLTGGCGFIGSNIARKLHKNCKRLDIVDNLSTGYLENLQDLPIRQILPGLISESSKQDDNKIGLYIADFASSKILESIARSNYDVIIHTAAIPRVSFSVENPAETTQCNLMNTVKLFDAARYGKARVVFSSSSSVYGGAVNLPTSESEAKNPKSPYAWQKSAAEDIAKLYCSLYDDSDIVCLRYFNVFGPFQRGDSAYATAVSAWCNAIANDLECRSDGDGTQSRDLCYVDNVVQANLLACYYENKFHGQCYNVACGDNTTNNQILTYFIDNYDARVRNAPWRKGDVMHSQADISLIQKDLGYKPEVRFWEGLEKTVEWWRLKKKVK